MDPIPTSPLQPATQPQPLIPETPRPKILLWILGGVLLLATGTVAGLFLGKQIYFQSVSTPNPSPIEKSTPTPDPTANWKTYVSSNNSFQFKYPMAFIVKEHYLGLNLFPTRLENTESWAITSGKALSENEVFFSFDPIPFANIPESLGDIENYFDNECKKTGLYCNIEKKKTTIANSEAIIVTWLPSTEKLVSTGAWILHNKSVFGIRMFALNNDTLDENQSTFDQILSTFKFLDQDSIANYTCPTNGWVNCMPILNDVGKKACSSEALDWYKSNCPNFQGVAY